MAPWDGRAILCVDQGTTGTRVSLIGAHGCPLGAAERPHRQITPCPGWVEHDAAEIWGNLSSLIRDLMAGQAAPVSVAGVGLANQGETVLAWDRHTGAPLANAIVWQDQRTQAAMGAMARNRAVSRRLTRLTGLRPDSYFSASKMRWLLDQVAAVRDAARQGTLCLSTLDSWLLWKLSGGRAVVTDASTAARTLLFSIRERRWDPWLLGLFGIERAWLPDVVPSLCREGLVTVHAVHPALEGTPVVTSMVDQPAAMAGHGCLRAGQTKATFGTGCFVYMHAGTTPPASDGAVLATIAWQSPGDITYALDGGVFAAAALVNWLCRLGLLRDPEEIDGLLADVDDDAGVVCVPALAGLACPHWDRDAGAAWVGMTLAAGRQHLVYAALAGLACRVAEVVAAMEKAGKQRVATLQADGGLTRSARFMQLQADVLGRPVAVLAECEATSLGLAVLGAQVLGWGESGSAGMPPAAVERVFEPCWPTARRTEFRDRFARVVRWVRRRPSAGL